MTGKSKGKTILIMEDEPILAQALTIELNGYGYKVIWADNGEDGLKHVYKDHPDLILLDLIMPKKTGYEVLADLRAKKMLSKLQIIVLTNLDESSDKKKALDLGAKNFFIKSSIDLEDLVKFIGKLLK